MQYQVFVQNQSEQRFIASIVGLPNVVVEGETEQEVIAKAKTALESQLATGKFVTIEVNWIESPQVATLPMRYAGIFADDPTFEDWMEKLAAIRQQENAVDDEE